MPTKVDGLLLKGDVLGGTASNTTRLVVPKDTKANLDLLTRKEANVLYGTDTQKAYIDNGTALVAIGSGSGGGGVNFIANGDADNATSSIFTTYADAAGTRPVDGTGGSPTVTTSVTSTTPLAGTKSFLLTKPASNVQGQGWSIPFQVDFANRTTMNKIKMNLLVDSGTFVAGSSSTDGDVIVYIYDVTNAKLIEPSNFKIFSNSSTNIITFEGDFQTSFVANGTPSDYRLILHCASTSALAYSVMVDNISIAPSQYVYAPTVTDSQLFTSTLSNFGNATQNLFYSRDGEYLLLHGSINIGSASPTGTMTFSLPAGLTINAAKLGAGGASQPFGRATGYRNSTGGSYIADIFLVNLSTNTFQFNSITGAYAPWNATAPITWASGTADRIMIFGVRVPIQGWTSNTQVSDGYDARDLRVNVARTTTLTGINPNNTQAKLNIAPTTVEDTYSGWDAANNRVLIKSSKDYDISFGLNLTTLNQVAGNYYILVLWKNGTEIASSTMELITAGAPRIIRFRGSITGVKANVTDYFELSLYSSANHSVSTLSADYIYLNVKANQAPTTMSATARDFTKLTKNTSTTLNNTAPVILFNLVDNNDLGNYNAATGELTIQQAGAYRITAHMRTNAIASAAIIYFIGIRLYINGASNDNICGSESLTTASTTHSRDGSREYVFNAGTKLSFGGYSDTAGTSSDIVVSIARIK